MAVLLFCIGMKKTIENHSSLIDSYLGRICSTEYYDRVTLFLSYEHPSILFFLLTDSDLSVCLAVDMLLWRNIFLKYQSHLGTELPYDLVELKTVKSSTLFKTIILITWLLSLQNYLPHILALYSKHSFKTRFYRVLIFP